MGQRSDRFSLDWCHNGKNLIILQFMTVIKFLLYHNIASTTRRRLDSPLGKVKWTKYFIQNHVDNTEKINFQTCCCVFFDTRWFVDKLGGRNARKPFIKCFSQKVFHSVCFLFLGLWRALAGRRLECKCWHVDVAFMQLIFSTIFSLLLPSKVWTKGRSKRRLY